MELTTMCSKVTDLHIVLLHGFKLLLAALGNWAVTVPWALLD